MSHPHHHILVCINERPPENQKGSCKPRGALEVYTQIRATLKRRDLEGKIAVNTTNCLKSCPFGATVVVWPEGHYYGTFTPEEVDSLIDSIQQGLPLDHKRIPAAEVGMY